MNKMTSFLVLLLLHYFHFFCDAQETVVCSWKFETNVSDSWKIQKNHKRFERVLYSSLNSTVPPQDGNWAVTGNGANNELLLPQVAYYGGNIKLTFFAFAFQPASLSVEFLNLNLSRIQNKNISIKSSSWTQYDVTLNSNQYQGSSAFLVSLIYSGESSIYLDSITIVIDGKIISCPTITSSNHCGFDTAGIGSAGWFFDSTAVKWSTSTGSTYLKRDFIYWGGLLKGSMNFRAKSPEIKVTIEISVNQTSYKQKISSGYTDFDLTTNTQYTVGQTYTILITFVTTTLDSILSSISMNVVGNCSECHSSLTCNKLTNGVNCVCNQNSCPGSHTQCIVSKTDQLTNPCSCQLGFIEDVFGNCVDVNECNSLTPPCSWNNGVCLNTNGSYSCSCNNGWILGEDNASCVDVNECNSLTPLCPWNNGVCLNTNGSYSCSCKNGWILGEDNASCVDVNECSSLTPPCSWSNGVCYNTNGSYLCSCKNGWMLDEDNASCVDIDECTSIKPICSWSNGVCSNTNGSFACSCKYGWKLGLDNTSCIGLCDDCQGKNKCFIKSATEAVCSSSSNSLFNFLSLTVLSFISTLYLVPNI